MTREEAIKYLERADITVGMKVKTKTAEAIEMAIKALEQEPCEDAVSRQAVLDCLTATGLKKYDFILNARDKIKNLPSVKPQEPRWIPVSEQLPEERDWYLAVFKEKDTGYQLIPRVADYIGENNWRIIDEEAFVKNYHDILKCVAWMPLPKPYKAESEES